MVLVIDSPFHVVLLNRMGSATKFAMQLLRWRLGYRTRPSKPQGLSPQTADAVRELVDTILKTETT